MFFTVLPINIADYDLNSLSFSQDSKSFLIPIIKKYLENGDLAFFVQYFIPIIKHLDLLMAQNRKQGGGSEIKAKKYETMIVQLWEILPNFCRFNSPKLSSAFATLIQFLEPMVNKNLLGLRSLALRVYSELIDHCRTTSVVTNEIK